MINKGDDRDRVLTRTGRGDAEGLKAYCSYIK